MSLGGQIANLIAANYKDGSTGDVPFDPSAGIGEFERRQFLRNQALPVPNQYQQIMGQGSSATPYSRIMGQMPLLQNPYAGVLGGYNNFQGGYNPNLYRNPAARSIRQLGFGGGGDGGGGGNDPYSDPNPGWSSLTPAEQAAYYAANPTMATLTQLGQKAFGYTGLGALQRAMQPGFVNEQSLIAMGVNPAAYQAAKESFRASEIADMNGGFQSYAPSTETGIGNPGESYSGGYTSSDTGVGNPGESDSGGYGGTSSDTGAGNPGESGGGQTSSESGVGNPGESGGGYGASGDGDSGWAKGGKVTKDRLKGPDPKGPDEGYGALLSGEYVIKKSAVNKYGTGLLDMINNGKIPAKKMKSLLG